jgi:hypothetical protein
VSVGSQEEYLSLEGISNDRALDHFNVPEREKQEVLAAIVARKSEVVNG